MMIEFLSDLIIRRAEFSSDLIKLSDMRKVLLEHFVMRDLSIVWKSKSKVYSVLNG